MKNWKGVGDTADVCAIAWVQPVCFCGGNGCIATEK